MLLQPVVNVSLFDLPRVKLAIHRNERVQNRLLLLKYAGLEWLRPAFAVPQVDLNEVEDGSVLHLAFVQLKLTVRLLRDFLVMAQVNVTHLPESLALSTPTKILSRHYFWRSKNDNLELSNAFF